MFFIPYLGILILLFYLWKTQQQWLAFQQSQIQLLKRIEQIQNHQFSQARKKKEQQEKDEQESKLKTNLKNSKDIVEKVVETTTESTRTIHKGLSDVSFDLLEALTPFKKTTQQARKLHDEIAKNTYASIHEVNKQIGGLTDLFLGSKKAANRKEKPKENQEKSSQEDEE